MRMFRDYIYLYLCLPGNIGEIKIILTGIRIGIIHKLRFSVGLNDWYRMQWSSAYFKYRLCIPMNKICITSDYMYRCYDYRFKWTQSQYINTESTIFEYHFITNIKSISCYLKFYSPAAQLVWQYLIYLWNKKLHYKPIRKYIIEIRRYLSW